MAVVLTDKIASVSDLKRNPMATVKAGEGGVVAILNRNKPSFYCVPVAVYEEMIERLEDAELNAIADVRRDKREIMVPFDEL